MPEDGWVSVVIVNLPATEVKPGDMVLNQSGRAQYEILSVEDVNGQVRVTDTDGSIRLPNKSGTVWVDRP